MFYFHKQLASQGFTFCALHPGVVQLPFILLRFKFFKPVLFVFPIVSDQDNRYKTMKNKNQTGLQNFKPNIKLNHNIYINLINFKLCTLCQIEKAVE